MAQRFPKNVPGKRTPPTTTDFGSGINTAIRQHDFADGSTTILVGRYDDAVKHLNAPGIQQHHLNQNAAYGTVIPRPAGISTPIWGKVNDLGSQHNIIHSRMEAFWDQFRGGDRMPTNIQYTQMVGEALHDAGFTPAQIQTLQREMIRQRLDYGLFGGDKVPKIPARLNLLAKPSP